MPTKLKTKPSARLLKAHVRDDFSDETLDTDGKVRPWLQSGVWWSCALRSLRHCVEKI
jgi:hypothetical protein